jgi:hypothetical protein
VLLYHFEGADALLTEAIVALRTASLGETGDQPTNLTQRRARLALDGDLQRGPTGEAVLAGDGQLSVVQAGELSVGEAAFRLDLEKTEVRSIGQLTRLIGQGSPSLGARGSASSGRKDSRQLAIENR